MKIKMFVAVSVIAGVVVSPTQTVLADQNQVETVIWSAADDKKEYDQACRAAQVAVLSQKPVDDSRMKEQSTEYQKIFNEQFKQAQLIYDTYFQLGKTFNWHANQEPREWQTLDHQTVAYQALMRGKEAQQSPESNTSQVPPQTETTKRSTEASSVKSGQLSNTHEKSWQPITDSGYRGFNRPAVAFSPGSQSIEPVLKPLPTAGFSGKLPVTESQRQFINGIAQSAQAIAAKHDLYASVMIAQAALESSWGTSELGRAPYHNLFGIKGGYHGHSVQMWTKEEQRGVKHAVLADFRRYPDRAAALNDYAIVMQQPLFQGALKSRTADYRAATQFLTSRYATDTSYAQKLNQIIVTYDLTRYDHAAETSHPQAAPVANSTPKMTMTENQLGEPSKHQSSTLRRQQTLPVGQKALFGGLGLGICLGLKWLLKL